MGWKRIALPVLAGAALLAFGCAFEVLAHTRGYRFFAPAAPADPWHGKIRGWQARERALPDTEQLAPAPASVSERGAAAAPDAGLLDLRTKYFAFRREQKRAAAAAAAAWIQQEARNHYRPDGAVDHWATLGETLARDGEDCDGLELLVYHHLRDMGFRDDEVTRAIVLRPRDGQHHMVTLWFESPDDPFVIDPTGAMTSGMPRLSEVPGWVPVELFTETAHYTPEPRDVQP